jgi:hypothetical protein
MKCMPCALAFLLLTILPAGAAPGGGRGGGGFFGDEEASIPTWNYNLRSVLGGQKLILLYVYPPTHRGTPSFLRHPDIAMASRGAFAFVRVAYKRDDPFLKALRITGAPVVTVIDGHGNEWRRATTLSQNGVKELLVNVPQEVSRYTETLDRSMAQAVAREDRGDARGALQIYKRIAAETKKGFPQILAARQQIVQLGGRRVQAAIAELPANRRNAVQELESISRDYGDTSVGARARLALLADGIESARDIQNRLAEIRKLALTPGEAYAPVVKEAKSVLAAVDGCGEALIEHALRKAKRGDTASAREILKQVVSDFSGTRAARQAGRELKQL